MSSQTVQVVQTFPDKIQKLQNFILFDVAGPRILCFRYQLDFFKGTTFLWVILLMYYFHNFSTGMYLYLFLHGTYGICWVIKDFWFPDQKVLMKGSIGSNMVLFTLLIGYWLIPVPLAAGYGINDPSIARMILLVVMYLLGVILMMGADYQKTMTLKQRKGLISTGFFKYSRNPNYLGEILIYSSFVFCSGHFVGFITFYCIGGLLFTLNIYVKQKCSYQKKQGWENYKKQSYILLPKLFQTFMLNIVFYMSLLLALAYFLYQESPSTFLYPLIYISK